MEDIFQLPPTKPVFRFPTPEFVQHGETRQAVAARSIENQQITGLSKISISAVTDGATVNSQYPTARRIAQYPASEPLGILSLILSSNIVNPVAGCAGVVLAVGGAEYLNVAVSSVIWLQHFAQTSSGGPSPLVSGVAFDGKSVEFLPANGIISIYAFAPNDATVLISAGATLKFAQIT